MSTAVKTRDVLGDIEGVIRVHPNGLNGKALVFVADKKKVTRKALETAFDGDGKLSVRRIKRVKA